MSSAVVADVPMVEVPAVASTENASKAPANKGVKRTLAGKTKSEFAEQAAPLVLSGVTGFANHLVKKGLYDGKAMLGEMSEYFQGCVSSIVVAAAPVPAARVVKPKDPEDKKISNGFVLWYQDYLAKGGKKPEKTAGESQSSFWKALDQDTRTHWNAISARLNAEQNAKKAARKAAKAAAEATEGAVSSTASEVVVPAPAAPTVEKVKAPKAKKTVVEAAAAPTTVTEVVPAAAPEPAAKKVKKADKKTTEVAAAPTTVTEVVPAAAAPEPAAKKAKKAAAPAATGETPSISVNVIDGHSRLRIDGAVQEYVVKGKTAPDNSIVIGVIGADNQLTTKLSEAQLVVVRKHNLNMTDEVLDASE